MAGSFLESLIGAKKYVMIYLISGLVAGVASVMWHPDTASVGASGAIFGLLLAYGLYFPERRIYLYFLFPIPAKYFVMIFGGVALLSSVSGGGGNLAHFTHLGGLVVGYVYLKSRRLARFSPIAELRYRYLKWKIGRMRRKFDVHEGGRSDDWDRKIH